MTDRPTSAPQPVALNINHIVRVRLTDSGRAALARQHVEFWANAGRAEPYPYTPPKEDAEGWSEWQLWNLMQDLGHLCRLGFEPPFETTIQLPQAAFDAAVAAAVAQERRQWITAIDEAMVCSHIGVFNDGDDPRAALNKVLAWHQVIALDPAVSSDARALQDRARAEERERCARICDTTPPYPFRPSIEAAHAIRAATPQEPT